MKLVDGWICPDMLSGPGKYLNRATWIEDVLPLCSSHDLVIQAGGHIGCVPRMLSKHFKKVITFEGDRENYHCLALNLPQEHFPNVMHVHALLGDRLGEMGMKRSPKSTGQHMTDPKGKGITTATIDSLNVEACSLIALDIEGFELKALAGATKTLDKFHPVVIAEENKRCKEYGVAYGKLEEFLSQFGYKQHSRVDEDIVFTWEKS